MMKQILNFMLSVKNYENAPSKRNKLKN